MGSRRRGQRLAAVAAAALAITAFTGASSAARAGVGTDSLGVYRGAAAPAQVSSFGAWLGRSPTYALDFLAMDNWAEIESPDWWLSGWGGSGYRVVYSVPMIPNTGGTLQQGANGAYTDHFVRLARDLVAHGQGTAILRLGWEFNGDWFKWSAASDPAAFAAYWREIVTAMRRVAPGLRFDWTFTLGAGRMPAAGVAAAYPGDAYVDFVGADVYDQAWGPNGSVVRDPAQRWQIYLTEKNGLDWLASFAAAHHKPISVPEWGLTVRADGHGGGDNTTFIQNMYDWLRAHDVAYQMYFEFDAPDGKHRLMTDEFPRGAAAYRALFGGSSSTEQTGASTTFARR